MGSPQASGSRRGNVPQPLQSNGIPRGTKEINAAPMLENAKPARSLDGPMTALRAIGIAGAMLHSTFPALIRWGLTMSLIFGGCCSNVG